MSNAEVKKMTDSLLKMTENERIRPKEVYYDKEIKKTPRKRVKKQPWEM